MRTFGYGKRENENKIKDHSHMSKLRQHFLVCIRTIGNHSGCHQMPERSFFYKNLQFPVCARCTGVFLGKCLFLILVWFFRIPPFLSVLFLCIMGFDWLLQWRKIKESTNLRRFFTGILGGFGIASLYLDILLAIIKKIQQ